MQHYNSTHWIDSVGTRIFRSSPDNLYRTQLANEQTCVEANININWRMIVTKDGNSFLMRFEVGKVEGFVRDENGREYLIEDGTIVTTDLSVDDTGANFEFRIREVLVYNSNFAHFIL